MSTLMMCNLCDNRGCRPVTDTSPPFRRRGRRRHLNALLFLVVSAGGLPRAQAQPNASERQSVARRLFVNFANGQEALILSEKDDATSNRTVLGNLDPVPAFVWPGGGEPVVRDAIVAGLHRVFLPYNVTVTDQRPPQGPYVMVMIGGTASDLGFHPNVAGLAPLDCHAQTNNRVAAVFPAAQKGNLRGLIHTIAQEAAHTFGLEHTADPTDLMHPVVSPEQGAFQDRNMAVVPPFDCGPREQNSHDKLLRNLGPWPGGPKPLADGRLPDIHGPEIQLVTPHPGLIYSGRVKIEAQVLDLSPPIEVQAFWVGHAPTVIQGPPYAGVMPPVGPGPNHLTVIAHDSNGNQSVSSMPFEIVTDPGGCSMSRRPHLNALEDILIPLFAWIVASFRLFWRRRKPGGCRSGRCRL